MFVYSVNKKQIRLAVIVVCLILMCIILGLLTKKSIDVSKSNELNLRASNASERIAYLAQFGLSVNEKPIDVKEVIIPSEFDDVYKNYNEIQLEQGFDLTQYASKRVKQWTYIVKNYPGYENSDLIRANMLIYDGKVIGGDICSVELNGFMHGFVVPQKNPSEIVTE